MRKVLKQKVLKRVYVEKEAEKDQKNKGGPLTGAKLVKGLENICSQLATLGVSADQPKASQSSSSHKAEPLSAEAFKKLSLGSGEINVKLIKSLKSLTCREEEEPSAVSSKLEGLPVSAEVEESSSDFYKRQRQEYTKYSRRQGKKLRSSQRKEGKSYRILEDLREDSWGLALIFV